jgi:hypothetical protein
MRIFCCNSADGCHGIFACGWCTVELLKHNEQSIRDTHIENTAFCLLFTIIHKYKLQGPTLLTFRDSIKTTIYKTTMIKIRLELISR